MIYSPEDYLMLSGIQHFCFCKRQWGLIHIEQQWSDNLLTVEGDILHKNVHDIGFDEKRGDKIVVRGMAINSAELGVSGVCDVVEFMRSEDGVSIFGREGKYKVIPVEYKRGKPKENDADRLQLAAQAMCLEEMLCCKIEKGFLYYGEIRRREEIVFDDEIRQKTVSMIKEMHGYFERGYTPKTKRTKSCNACSLKDICLPGLQKNISAGKYIRERLDETE
ncbi:MAG: CRISPR-associated protein Cas4 [Oscillospiraceae bacterium]|nr:CRISPR-associated protein Cas4 [Oscillospiraceae bacterium]